MERIPAGNVEFLVETREAGGDGGPSIQVRTVQEGTAVQLLRFDCFRTKPHYHYAPTGMNTEYNIDPTVVSDSLGWAVGQLQANLGPMIDRAGYPGVAENLEPAAVADGLAQVVKHFSM